MTLSCRAQAFSVDNLLRPTPATFAASPSLAATLRSTATSTNELSSTLEIEKLLFNNRKHTKNTETPHNTNYSHIDNRSKNLRYTQSFSSNNVKLESTSPNLTQEIFTLKRQFQPDLKDTIKPFRGTTNGNSSENIDDQISELLRFHHHQSSSLKPSEEGTPSDESSPSKKLRSSKNAGNATSCFCHGDVIFCHHPGIASVTNINGSDNSIIAELCHADLWTSFHRLGTEMIITKTGRRMFPALKVRITGLYPDKHYIVRLEFVQPDTRKYRYIYHSSRWMVSGSGDTLSTLQSHKAPDGPVSGQAICSQIVSFERLKLTNTDPCKTGQVSLVSMQKFQPQIVIQEVSNLAVGDASECEQYVIMFPQTSFMAVTAYQNQQITTLKIASNPFAKGFRESGKARIPYESFMATIPNFLSCDNALNYLSGVVRSSAWSPRTHFFPPGYNFSMDKRYQDRQPSGDHYKDSTEKIVKMADENPGNNRCPSDLTTATTTRSSPALFAALQKPVPIPLPQRHIHPPSCHLYEQQQRHFQNHLLVPTPSLTLHPLLQPSPFLSEQHRLIAAPLTDILPRGDHSQNTQPQTTICSAKPPPAHMPLPTTTLFPHHLISNTSPNMPESFHLYPHQIKNVMPTNDSPNFINRQFGNTDIRVISDSNSLSTTSHSISEQKCPNGRSRSLSYNATSAFNVMPPPRCMTEPSKMAAKDSCRCVICRYQATPSSGQ